MSAGRTLPVDLDSVSLVDVKNPDRQLVELVQAIAKCDEEDAQYALTSTSEGDSAPMAWCARAVVYLRRIGFPTNDQPRGYQPRSPRPGPDSAA